MALLLLVAVAILVGLGFMAPWLFAAAGILLLVWLAGWIVRLRGGRWYFW